MVSFGRRMLPMFTMAAIAIVIASGVSYASREGDDSAPAPFAADRCVQVHDIAAGDCATAWFVLLGSQN